MAKKITKVEMFGMIKARVNDSPEMVAFIENEIELLNRKAQNKKATKVQEANVGLKALIVDVLNEKGVAMTVTEIQSANAELGAFSNQKVSALVKQLVDDKVVNKVVDKKVSRFSVNVAE